MHIEEMPDISDFFDDDDNIHTVYGRVYIDEKKLFSQIFNSIPSAHLVGDIDVNKAVDFFKTEYRDRITKVYCQQHYKHKEKKYSVMQCLLVLKDERMLVFTMTQFDILAKEGDDEFVKKATEQVLKFKRKDRDGEFEINLITNDSMQGMGLTRLQVNKAKLDIAINYEDDFVEIDKIIRERLNKKKDKGIVLLHGIPGTGKTTYLRFLIGKIKKKVMFLPPNVAANMTNPDFVNILIENPNSVLIIEDAENIITDRKESGSSAVSNLLNISDGLLADCLNTQIICTFNTQLSNIDSALLRKGRLIAMYEFGKLSAGKSQTLSNQLGFETVIDEPMTLTEIYNQHEKGFEKKKFRAGFMSAKK